MFGVLAGVATAAVAVAVRPRGGTGVLVDWDDVRSAARAYLDHPATPGTVLAAAEKRYRAMAEDLEKPLLDFVGRLPVGVQMPRFEAVDREGWLDLNLAILRRVIDPVLELGRVPNSLIVDAGRAGIDRYVGFMLGFLGHRVLGQFDPQLLGAEPVAADGLYLVETNVEEWAKKADLPGEDLRRWLILHEMTHAWQFAAHPWLRADMEQSIKALLESTTKKAPTAARIAAFAGILPAQWRVMRRVQGTMSLVEGYSNLVMNELGARLLPGFERIEEAYRARSSGKSILELLIWKLSGLDLKLQQYRLGEAFAKAIYDAHGMEVLNLAWQGPQTMPRLEELSKPEAWYRRVAVPSSRPSPRRGEGTTA